MRRAGPALIVILLAGCGSVPRLAESELSYEVPQAWTAADDAALARNVSGGPWWNQFGDERRNEMVVSALRANINETLLGPLITEQGENGSQRED